MQRNTGTKTLWMGSNAGMFHDLSYAARALYRRRGFTLAAVLSLASGIGVTTAMFTVLNAVALRPLPYPAAAARLPH